MSESLNACIGIDTSNYTTSAALFSGGEVKVNSKKLLPVRPGEVGLRQSDAVFHHVQQLPGVLAPVLEQAGKPVAIGVSDRPRAVEGSYMPCFTVGKTAAAILAQTHGVPLHQFSHQQGHIAAAAYSAGKLDLLKEKFLVFHVSGGTTEALFTTPGVDGAPQAELVAASLDLKAGQAVDRVGVMLGLPFPAGPHLEQLAVQWHGKIKVRPVMKGSSCSLSGVENRCRAMMEAGHPREEIARYCLEFIRVSLAAMCTALLEEYGSLPVVFAGGVMSNGILRESLSAQFGAYFAQPAFSADNAAGTAVLAARKEGLL